MAKVGFTALIESGSGKLESHSNTSLRTQNGKSHTYTWDPEAHPYRPTFRRQVQTESMRLANLDAKAISADPEQLAPYLAQHKTKHLTTPVRSFIVKQRMAFHKADLLARFANDEPAFQAYLATIKRK